MIHILEYTFYNQSAMFSKFAQHCDMICMSHTLGTTCILPLLARHFRKFLVAPLVLRDRKSHQDGDSCERHLNQLI